MSEIPQQDWFCEGCRVFERMGCFATCLLCPCQGGILKETSVPITSSRASHINRDYINYHKSGYQSGGSLVLYQKDDSFTFKIQTAGFENRVDDVSTEIFGSSPSSNGFHGSNSQPSADSFSRSHSLRPFGKSARKGFDKTDTKGEEPSETINQGSPLFLYYDFEERMRAVDLPSTSRLLFRFAPQTKHCWAHLTCLKAAPAVKVVSIDQTVKIELPTHKVPARKCVVCGYKLGMQVKCVTDTCEVYFHAECARRVGLKAQVEPEDECPIRFNCVKHSQSSPQHLIDQRVTHREAENKLFFEMLGKVEHMARAEEHRVGRPPQVKSEKVADVGPSFEYLVKHLHPEDKEFMQTFREARLSKKSAQTVVYLKRSKKEPRKFRFVRCKLGSGSLYPPAEAVDPSVWQLVESPVALGPNKARSHYQDIHRTLENVRKNPTVYFAQLPNGEFQKILDIYEPLPAFCIDFGATDSFSWLDSLYFAQPSLAFGTLEAPEMLPKPLEQVEVPRLDVPEEEESTLVGSSPMEIEGTSPVTPLDAFNSAWTRFFERWSSREGTRNMEDVFGSLPVSAKATIDAPLTEERGSAEGPETGWPQDSP